MAHTTGVLVYEANLDGSDENSTGIRRPNLHKRRKCSPLANPIGKKREKGWFVKKPDATHV